MQLLQVLLRQNQTNYVSFVSLKNVKIKHFAESQDFVMQKKLLSSKCTNLQDIKTVGVSTFGQIQGHFDLTPIFLVASKENGLQNSSKPSITKLIEARITKGVTKTTRNKMPEGINVGRTGHHLQSLKFYMEKNKFNSDSSKQRNEIASQQDRILCEVTHPNSNLSQQGLISVRSTST